MLTKPLSTKRLQIRGFTKQDWPDVHRYTSLPHIMEYMEEDVMTVDDTQAFVEKQMTDDTTAYPVILKAEEKLIGHIVYHPWFAPQTYEIGWVLHPDYHRHGYTAEAAMALLSHGFEEMRLHRIIATCQPENIASWGRYGEDWDASRRTFSKVHPSRWRCLVGRILLCTIERRIYLIEILIDVSHHSESDSRKETTRMPITIHSIFVGQPQTMTDEKGEWSSSIYRTLVDGPIELGERGLDGDRVTDTKHHGAPGQAVCCHSMEHYDFWNEHYDIAGTGKALGPGSVGENWTLLNADEAAICIGDIYTVGTAKVQVSGPRYPCSKQQRKVGLRAFLLRTKETLRTGFYLSTLQTGTIQAGDPWRLEERPAPGNTIRLVNETVFQTKTPEIIEQLLAVPELDDGWKRILRRLPKK